MQAPGREGHREREWQAKRGEGAKINSPPQEEKEKPGSLKKS